MASIGLEFFALPEEWPGLIEKLDPASALWKTLVKFAPDFSLQLFTPGSHLSLRPAVARICVTMTEPDLSAKTAHEFLLLNPNALIADMGSQENSSLFASALGARPSDPDVLARWQAVLRDLKKQLKRGLWVKNPVTGAKSFSKSFWYTEGAAEFSVAGGVLRPAAGWNVLSVREPRPS